MTVKRQKAALRLIVLIAFAVLIGIRARYRPLSHPQKAAFGRYSAQMILARADALNATLIPADANRNEAIQPMSLQNGRGGARRVYEIDCGDGNGQNLTTSLWDADTGGLIKVWHAVEPAGNSQHVHNDRREAVQAAWRWMKQTGIASTSRHWRVEQAPRSDGGNWVVLWRGEDCRVCVTLDRNSYELVYLSVEALSKPPNVLLDIDKGAPGRTAL